MKELTRRLVRSLVCFILRIRSRSYEMPTNGHCVVIAPHPDDEALGCGGLILTWRACGARVSIVYLTDGAGSHPHHPQFNVGDIAKIRHDEAVKAMQLLLVDGASLHFLDAPDGTLAHLTPPEAEILARRLAAMLTALQPTELFITCRDDTSSEHTGAFELTSQALNLTKLRPRLLEYPVWARWRPQHLLRISRTSRQVWRLNFLQKTSLKRAALNTYASQSSPTPPWTNSVLPRGFVDCFDSPEEFFFER